MTDNDNTFECSVEGCGDHKLNDYEQPYGTCQHCEEFSICDKRDEAHEAALLYWEMCRKHHSGGYAICIKCALWAFNDLMRNNGEEVKEGEEHCICPECQHNFGLLHELQYPTCNKDKETKFVCSINGFHKDTSDYGRNKHFLEMAYSYCTHCCEFAICGKQDAEHEASMLYWEGCCAHDSGGYSICINCSLEAFKNFKKTLGEEIVAGEEHCICPKCKHDFGLFKDIKQ